MSIIERQMELTGHELTVEKNPYGPGWLGGCDCSDPDWTGDGWDGQVVFFGDSEDDIVAYHFEHVLEVAGDE